MLTGLVIAWVFAVPILTAILPTAAGMDFAAHAADVWSHQVRFIGAGAIGISSIWTLVTLAKPVVGGLMTTLAAARGAAAADERDRDLSPTWIYALTVVCLAIAAWLAFGFRAARRSTPRR